MPFGPRWRLSHSSSWHSFRGTISMPSSTSSSKSPALVHARVLLGICALLVLFFEIFADYLLKHDSETYGRVSQQYAEAVKVRPSRSGEPASVLMLGNSLLMEGIDVQRLQELTSSKMRIYPIFLEATGYYDWLYGLERLFRQGARPQVVVLGVGVNSFLQDSVRQDYAPMMFFDVRDVLGAASIVPIKPETLSEKFNQTHGHHLNPERATHFTSALATYLPEQSSAPKSTSSHN